MVKSDIGCEAKTNTVKAAVIDGFMTVVMKSTEGGARMLVRYTVTRAEENGKHISDVPEDEWKQFVHPSSSWVPFYEPWLILSRSVQHNIQGPEGQKMQEEVWKEVVTILAQQAPEVKEISHITTA